MSHSDEVCLVHGNALHYDTRSGFDLCAECEREKPINEEIPIIEVPPAARCQEALPFNHYIPCGEPATVIVYHEKDRRGYYMCLSHADHNIHNRGGKWVGGDTRLRSR